MSTVEEIMYADCRLCGGTAGVHEAKCTVAALLTITDRAIAQHKEAVEEAKELKALLDATDRTFRFAGGLWGDKQDELKAEIKELKAEIDELRAKLADPRTGTGPR